MRAVIQQLSSPDLFASSFRTFCFGPIFFLWQFARNISTKVFRTRLSSPSLRSVFKAARTDVFSVVKLPPLIASFVVTWRICRFSWLYAFK